MAKPVQKIASELQELLRLKGNNEIIMLTWNDFYQVCERERMAEVIQEHISNLLRKEDIHIIYGNRVIIVRDFSWAVIQL